MKLLQAPCREAMITSQVYGVTIQTTQSTGVTGVMELNFTVVSIITNHSLVEAETFKLKNNNKSKWI